MSKHTPLLIGIAGGTGSGKTSVTNAIAAEFGSDALLVVQHDSYYRDVGEYRGIPPSEINFDHPRALETSLLIEHLSRLKAGQPAEQPVYDFSTHRRSARTVRLESRAVILVDGILVLAEKELRDLLDIKIFVDTDADERFIRRLRRDINERGRTLESVIGQYLSTVKPMHLEFVEPSKRWADVIIPGGAENTVAVGMVVTMIRQRVGT
jgi:uridine kinase